MRLPLVACESEDDMIEETISKLEARLKNSTAMPVQSRDELLQLLGTLKQELSDLNKAHGGDTEHIIGYTPVPASPPSRPGSEPVDVRNFVASVQTSHPQFVSILNRISEILADLGI